MIISIRTNHQVYILENKTAIADSLKKMIYDTFNRITLVNLVILK